MTETSLFAGPVRGSALDLDGVLLDGMPFHYEAFNAALHTFGVHGSEREVALLEGMRTREVIKRIANSHGVFPEDSELDEAERLKRKIYSTIFHPQLMPGAIELVSLLAQRGCRLAIVTGTADASAHAAVQALHAESLFNVIISHDSNIPMKPDPAPYATAARQLSVAPEQCLAIENAPAGLASAVGAGLRCFAVASYLERADLQGAERVFETLADLTAWLSERRGRDTNGNWVV